MCNPYSLRKENRDVTSQFVGHRHDVESDWLKGNRCLPYYRLCRIVYGCILHVHLGLVKDTEETKPSNLVKKRIIYRHTRTLPIKSLGSVFKILNEISYAHQGCIYLIKNTEKTLILWNLIANSNNGFLFQYTLKYNLFLTQNFHQHLLQSSVSHDPSEIILICWFIFSVKTVVLLNIFMNLSYFFLCWIKSKKSSIFSK